MEKKYDFKKIEKEMQMLWGESNTYAFELNTQKKIYSIDTPPPTVNGSMHIGHIFSYTQAEMIARFKRMQGYNVFYPFGFDDNGLPTERLVEKKQNILAKSLPRKEFIGKCVETSKKYETEFKELWQSLGLSVDWSLQYETINPKSQRISQKSFIRLAKENKAYLKESPVLWCTECQTSIAQAEVETKDIESTFNTILFNCGNDVLAVATTRPELLYGCVCLLINPNDLRYKHYIGKKALVPLYQFEIPIIADELVSIDKGTGIVMCATFGDTTDVLWYEKYNLPYKKVIMSDGSLNKEIPFIGGLMVLEARKRVIELLLEQGLLTQSQNITHAVSIHERCGKEIEIIPSKQWYIDIMSKKQVFLDAADQINWYPAQMKNRYQLWVQNLKWDWCISRQRYFGVPIPVWYCKNCNNVILANEADLPINPLESGPNKSCSCGSHEFIPESAVLDTWATSSLTPQINALWEEANDRTEIILPMSLRTQAHEIIRTWAFYTIVKSLYHTGNIPWKDIMISGFVLAKKGEKISKSKNNSVLSPKNLIENHSADAIRYWAANTKLGTDTFFSEDELSIAKRLITKLWNAAKFAIFHLHDYEPGIKENLLPVDKWIIESCNKTILNATKLLNEYEIGMARHIIDEFFWNDFCDYYLEIVKERLYQPEKHGIIERQSAQNALYYCLFNILKMYAIFIPHITEYIYQEFFKQYEIKTSIHQHIWENIININDEMIYFGEKLKEIIREARKYKSLHNLSMKDEMEEIVITCKGQFISLFKQTEMDLMACLSANEIRIKEEE